MSQELLSSENGFMDKVRTELFFCLASSDIFGEVRWQDLGAELMVQVHCFHSNMIK